MPKKKSIKVRCPRCKETREVDIQFKNYPKTCPECWPKVEKERRLSTKRKFAPGSFCRICIENTKFEYFLKPPRDMRNKPTDRLNRLWLAMCDTCFNHWLEKGTHREPPQNTQSASSPIVGSIGRPSTQDERDTIEADKRIPVDNNTGLSTYEWLRGR